MERKVEANLVHGEAGLGKSTIKNDFGEVIVRGPGAKGNVGLRLSTRASETRGGLYGKAFLAQMEGKKTFNIPFTKHKITIGAEADFISIGGGLDVDVKRRRVKFGLHIGVGGDIIISLD